jgi:hypothetical protein
VVYIEDFSVNKKGAVLQYKANETEKKSKKIKFDGKRPEVCIL